ncbi:hypothetical protein [Novosphingobium terrae]|uniref:hypothetical protein n=1 Tax=Novosphingobium terrae TaxID=2726189 RepID=UPI0019826F00|nr:hypothetical protein [Novosphingobium terrae]
MTQDDELARSLIFKRFFPGNIHTDASLWAFGATEADGKAHESGLALSLAPTSDALHRAGCAIAAAQNKTKGEPEPGPLRRYYCGYRQARVSDLPLEGETYAVTLNIDGATDISAHVDVALSYKVEGKNPRANARTKAGMALAEAFGPAVPYICTCDSTDKEHPLVKNGLDCLTSAFVDRWPNLYLGEIKQTDQGWTLDQTPPAATDCDAIPEKASADDSPALQTEDGD